MGDSDSSLTPEQKLLKLIENTEEGGAKPSEEGAVQDDKKGEKGKGAKISFSPAALFSPTAIKGRIAYLKTWSQSLRSPSGQVISFQQINQVLKIGSFLLFVALMFMVIVEVNVVNQDYGQKFAVPPQSRAQIPLDQLYPYSNNLFTNADKENVFVGAEQRFAGESEVKNISVEMVQLIQNLKLTGISVNPVDNTQTFCMIEDLEKDVTSFLKVGDAIAGMRVHSISEEGVMLRRGEEEIPLR